MRTKIPGSSGTKGPSRNTSKIPWRRFRAPKWRFRGLRTRRKPKICGASSSSSDRTARRNEQFSSRFILIIESVVDRIEVDDHAIRIIGDEAILEQVIVGSTKTAPGVRSFVPKWRARRDSNLSLLKNPFGLRIGWQVKITTDDIDDISSGHDHGRSDHMTRPDLAAESEARCPRGRPRSFGALERVPMRLNRERALDSLFGRIFCGEPLHTSPENALARPGSDFG